MTKGRRPIDPEIKTAQAEAKRRLADDIFNCKYKSGLSWIDFIDEYELGVTETVITKFKLDESSYKTVKRVHDKLSEYYRNNDNKRNIFHSVDEQNHDNSSLKGVYALVRPSVHEKEVLYAYRTEIFRSEKDQNYFLKIESPDSVLDEGKISIIKEHQSICVHFNKDYFHGILIMKMLPGRKHLYGLMSSLFPSSSEHHFSPGSVPVALIKEEKKLQIGEGYIAKKHNLYQECLSIIKDVPNRDIVLSGWWN